MFGRGTWAIVGLATESLEAFRTRCLENLPIHFETAHSPYQGIVAWCRRG